jgi:predicted RND superfamily exporter protein
MIKEEFEEIVGLYKDAKNRSNSELVNAMNSLTKTHFDTKKTIIDLTYYLDSVEEMYNKILEEYNSRNKNG